MNYLTETNVAESAGCNWRNCGKEFSQSKFTGGFMHGKIFESWRFCIYKLTLNLELNSPPLPPFGNYYSQNKIKEAVDQF